PEGASSDHSIAAYLFFFHCYGLRLDLHSFPTRRSSDLFATAASATRAAVSRALARSSIGRASSRSYFCIPTRSACPGRGRVSGADRKSTRLNSSHDQISYAVFCLKKKKERKSSK